jgi:integrase/recombinase XerD
MKLSKAIEGWLLAKSASGLSPDTAQSYRSCGGNLARFLDDKEIEDVTTKDLRRWMIYLKEEYEPQGIRAGQPGYRLSWGSLYAYWRAMKSLFHWAHDDLGIPRVDDIKPPEGQYPVVVPFTEEETRAMLKAAERITINDKNQKHYTKKTPQSDRNVAILTLLLDTGLRVGELERLTVSDVNTNTGEIMVKPHGTAKKTHGRVVYMGKAARKALWKYLSARETYPNDPLFLTDDGRAISQNTVRQLVTSVAKRAGVQKAHPHKFRHTFAIQFLRNGGNVFALQKMLGHNSLEMCKRYLALVEDDL